ncbi:MAG: hypothetical protein D6E12_13095 [Desulfovibrio sp.]|nr:MAG: hypothetical protein D6E12_13095 [Desulfovibrio sp.]
MRVSVHNKRGAGPRGFQLIAATWLARVALVLALCVAPLSAAAEGWETEISGTAFSPSLVIGIDKSEQQLFLFMHQSPLSVAERFTCTTGEQEGDKFAEGDLRTPEGVYFTETRIDTGLDYDLFGDLAYTLNFPNPVDRLRGKTGSGIWIHGRGHEIVPRETRGCVALEMDDMNQLETHLASGVPVVIARDLDWAETAQDEEYTDRVAELAALVEGWAGAWQSRSEEFFSFYDPERFSRAQGSFAAFRAHKEGLFRNLPWIQVSVHDIRVVEGPDYWVTYFGQFYRSPSLTSEGIKRLYWMEDESGELKIVGKEWVMARQGLEERYVESLAEDATDLVEQWRTAWEQADMDEYLAFYADNASQGGRRGLEAIRNHKQEIWARGQAMSVGVSDVQVRLHSQGLAVSFVQEYQAGEYRDTGVKTLILMPDGNQWEIVSETWSAR